MINWTEQWEAHAPGFTEGKLRVDLADYGGKGSFALLPGPGFGDLSHPTTRLVLEAMIDKVPGRHVIDIGSGSGILSVAAHHLGALSVTSIDIDPAATAHTLENAALSGFCPKTTLDTMPPNPLILMNMITSEQRLALPNDLPPCTLITSGILASEENAYLEWIGSYNVTKEKRSTDNQWTSFIFNKE